MKKEGFKYVREGGEVSIVREKPTQAKSGAQTAQRLRVMCFDSAQIDRIFQIQENSLRNVAKI